MPIHVSIHDVSPAWQREIDLALEFCDDVGAKAALLVVPNFHGAWPLLDHPKFCERLQKLQAAGHEIYLHGFFHRSRSEPKSDVAAGAIERARWLFAQKIASGGEAEFSDVSREEAITRLDQGADVLGRAGLSIDGFVPPAWSMPPWLSPLLASRGVRFTEDHTHVYDPREHTARASVVLNYASRTPGRLLTSAAWCRIAKYARALVPARIAIHPADMRYSLLRHEVRELLKWGRGDFVSRGSDLLAS